MGKDYDAEYANNTDDEPVHDKYDAWEGSDQRTGKAWEDRRESPGSWDSHE